MKPKTKIEIIDIKLNVDLSKVIQEEIDVLSDQVKQETQRIVERNKLKAQLTASKEKKVAKVWDGKITKAFEILKSALESTQPWVSGQMILREVNAESDSMNAFSQRLRNHLKKTAEFVLQSERRPTGIFYRLERYGPAPSNVSSNSQ
jgi:hypothetical protein